MKNYWEAFGYENECDLLNKVDDEGGWDYFLTSYASRDEVLKAGPAFATYLTAHDHLMEVVRDFYDCEEQG